MTVCCPADPYETKSLINQSYDRKGPIYFRLGKGNEQSLYSSNEIIKLGQASRLKDGNDAVIISTGNTASIALKYAEELDRGNIVSCAVVSMHTIKPIDYDIIKYFIDKNFIITTLEEHNIIGGLGSRCS
ncbi:MAG: hypothetical protein MZU95_04250 [Desulfomicrobium escambiense]|nr:hypothetical protein [Desulfomicrobium escambiense]